MEFFRQIELLFSGAGLVIENAGDPNLEKTALDGVATFSGEIISTPNYYSISRARSNGVGVGLIITSIILIFFMIDLSPPPQLLVVFLSILATLLVLALFAFSHKTLTFTGKIRLSIKGESYHGLAIGAGGQRSSVFSRATLKTDWIRGEDNPATTEPVEFFSLINLKLASLDKALLAKLPVLEMKKVELPDTNT